MAPRKIMSRKVILQVIAFYALIAICVAQEIENDNKPLPMPVCLDGKMVYINNFGRIVIKTPYDYYQFGQNKFSEELAGFQENKKYGFIDETGKIIIQPAFDYIGGFSEGIAEVRINGKWGFIDRTGQMLIRPQYDKT